MVLTWSGLMKLDGDKSGPAMVFLRMMEVAELQLPQNHGPEAHGKITYAVMLAT